ncbi:hypothetical protein BDY21DRAFT_338631 [Lineolata rhizophorae]|uniref:Uncharacterized protein n=1 Tax=Lineolata rhizophorae TaxID=578093 RepID=A0A6A6P6W2_9PEZI|nr:hypothetical protein BDY21DRAFT_338631 [Lineolata rhizophorae]
MRKTFLPAFNWASWTGSGVVHSTMQLPSALVLVSEKDSAGIPYIVQYVVPINLLWLLFGNTIVDYCQNIPFCSGFFTLLILQRMGATESHLVYLELGDVFMLVTPSGNGCACLMRKLFTRLSRGGMISEESWNK